MWLSHSTLCQRYYLETIIENYSQHGATIFQTTVKHTIIWCYELRSVSIIFQRMKCAHLTTSLSNLNLRLWWKSYWKCIPSLWNNVSSSLVIIIIILPNTCIVIRVLSTKYSYRERRYGRMTLLVASGPLFHHWPGLTLMWHRGLSFGGPIRICHRFLLVWFFSFLSITKQTWIKRLFRHWWEPTNRFSADAWSIENNIL